jgi:hypothetical protein
MRIGLLITVLVSWAAAQVTVTDTFFTGTYGLDADHLIGDNVKISGEGNAFGFELEVSNSDPAIYQFAGGANAGVNAAFFTTPVTTHFAYMDSTGTFYDTTTWQRLGGLNPVELRAHVIVIVKKFRMHPPTSAVVMPRTVMHTQATFGVTKTVDVRGVVTKSVRGIHIQNGNTRIQFNTNRSQ